METKETNLELTQKEKNLLENIQKSVNEIVSEKTKGFLSESDFNQKMDEIDEKLKSLNEGGQFDKAINEMNEFRENLKNLGNTVETMKNRGIQIGTENKLVKAIDDILDTQKFKDFVDGKTKSTGAFTLDLKEIVSFENSYEGNILTSQQSNVVNTKVGETRVNLRDVMIVDQGDPTFTSITFSQITDLDRNAAAVSENGRLPESSFKIKEKTADIARIGTYLTLSKRLLKSRTYVRNFLLNRLPLWVKMAENFQIMFGDGQGENMLGIINQEGVQSISDIITKTVVTGSAGDVKSVSSYNGGKQTLVEFSKPFEDISNGQLITFAAATGMTDLNDEFEVNKINDRQIMIDVAYAEVTNVSSVTFTVKNNFFNKVEDPNVRDAINAIFSVLTYAEYYPNAIVLNPSTIFEASTAKDTSGRSLDLITTANGVSYIGGRPIIESTAIKPGWYLAGDFMNGVSLTDFTSLVIELAEDTETKKRNTVDIIAQEEVIMPVYNPFAFAYGKISDVLTAITKS